MGTISNVTCKVRACLNETLRLFPPVPGNSRASVRATVLPSPPGSKPIYMPGPDVVINYSDMLMHRRKDLWGPDAEEFVPERWTDPERLKSLTRDPFKFLPFNAGPRICLGQVGVLFFSSLLGSRWRILITARRILHIMNLVSVCTFPFISRDNQ